MPKKIARYAQVDLDGLANKFCPTGHAASSQPSLRPIIIATPKNQNQRTTTNCKRKKTHRPATLQSNNPQPFHFGHEQTQIACARCRRVCAFTTMVNQTTTLRPHAVVLCCVSCSRENTHDIVAQLLIEEAEEEEEEEEDED